MKKLILLFIIPFVTVAQEGQLNLSFFSKRNKASGEILEKYLSMDELQHPEAGLMPFDGPPCDDCIELVGKRKENARYFVDVNDGHRFFQQTSYGALHYRDDAGRWLEINPRLEKTGDHVYESRRQPSWIKIDMHAREASIEYASHVMKFCMDPQLFVVDGNREIPLGVPDWSEYSAGDDGIRVIDIYPGVDLVISVGRSKAESRFILKRPLMLKGKYLVMRQGIEAGSLSYHADASPVHGDKRFSGSDGNAVFMFEKCFAFDESRQASAKLSSEITSDALNVYTPVSWLNDPSRVYPVVIDPVVTTQNTLPVASVAGTRYSATCWTNSCDYFLTVPTPANATITNFYYSFEYETVGAVCQAQDGGYSIEFQGCHYPSAAPQVVTCPFPVSFFNCGAVNTLIGADFNACIPAPQCAPHNLDFTLKFYRCNNDPDTSCASNCIRASQPWIMTVEGRTLEALFITPPQTRCEGEVVPLTVHTDFGVPPYSFAWTGSALNNDSITVTPSATTNYTVTVTDACGITASLSTTITITPDANPGFTINPQPACIHDPVTFTGNGASAATDYDWLFPGSDAPGGVVNDSQSAVVSYSIPGVYQATLNYTSGSCIFDSVINVTIDPAQQPDILITAFPGTSGCPGDTIRFRSVLTNGGVNPQIDWYIDGSLLQSGAADSLVTSSLVNGSHVQAVLHTNASCVFPLTDTASLFISLTTPVTPSVQIVPDTSVCEGSQVEFTALIDGGGGNPSIQWYVNGVAQAGETDPTFVHTISAADTIIGLNFTSSLGCITATGSSDSAYVTVRPRVFPDITIASDPGDTICIGQQVDFTATVSNEGASPLYHWYVNSILVQAGGTTFNPPVLTHGEVVYVVMEPDSGADCAVLVADTSNIIRILNYPPVSVNIDTGTAVCPGIPVTLTAVATGGDGEPYSYTWNISSENNDTITAVPEQPVPVTVEVSDGCTVSSGSDSLILTPLPGPRSEFSSVPYSPGSFDHTIVFTNLSTDAIASWWYFGTGDSTDASNPVYAFPGLGTYPVTLVTIGSNGCTDTITYTVIVSELMAVYFPNAFTPNGDLVNDFFQPVGASLNEYEMLIYNRWGEVVFEGGKNKAWDGTIRDTGTRAPEGVYVVRIDLKDPSAEKQVLTGRVTLIR